MPDDDRLQRIIDNSQSIEALTRRIAKIDPEAAAQISDHAALIRRDVEPAPAKREQVLQ